MEPYHQLRFHKSLQNGINAQLTAAGIDVQKQSGQSWLSPEFRDVLFVREGEKKAFAFGVDPEDENFCIFVYPNVASNPFADEIRQILESAGAKWAYFS